MSTARVQIAATACSLLLMTIQAHAFHFLTGRGTGLGETVVLSRSSASGLVLLPSAGIDDREAKLEFSANRDFGLLDLDHISLAAAYRYRSLTTVFGVSQMGFSGLYTERLFRGGVAWHSGRLAVGGTVSGLAVEFGGGRYDGLSAATFGLDATLTTPRVAASIMVDNITEPALDDQASRYHPIYAAFLEMRGIGSFLLTGRVTLEKFQEPQFALGQVIAVSERGSLFWGLSSEPLEYGGGIEIRIGRQGISYAASYHPTLGLSQTMSLSFSLGVQTEDVRAEAE